MATEGQKFVRMFGRGEIHLTACAVTKDLVANSLLLTTSFDNHFSEPNQFWKRDSRHERALMKVYKRYPDENSTFFDSVQTLKIPMPFLGHDSSDGWGELQFLIKSPRLVKLARHRSFDTRVNRWVEEIQLIQPKTDFGTHTYLAIRFYHQSYLPETPSDWRFEPVYVSVMNLKCVMFYRIDVFWEKEEIEIKVTVLEKNSPEIPKHLR